MARIFSKTSLEGYLEMDHSESPGITEEEAAQAGNGTIPIPAGTKFQAATYNCKHCEMLVVKNPLRKRERAHCRKCDRDICDKCGVEYKLTGECQTMDRKLDVWYDQTVKAMPYPTIILPPGFMGKKDPPS